MLVNAAHGQYKPFFRLAGYSGMRCSELAGLRYEDINFDRGIVEVRRSATYGIEAQTKTPAGRRTIYVDTITLQMLREHLAGRRAGLVFQTKFGTHLKATDINRHVLKPLCVKLGIPKGTTHSFRHGRISLMELCKADIHEVASPTARLRFHDLRHHAITELAEGQASEQTIRSIAGHVSQKMLEHYSHIRLDAKRTALDALSQRGGKAGYVTNNVTKGPEVAQADSEVVEKIGGRDRDRTGDLLVANEALSQLSYSPPGTGLRLSLQLQQPKQFNLVHR